MKIPFSFFFASLLVIVCSLPALAQLPDRKQLPIPSAIYSHPFRNDSDRQREKQNWRSLLEKRMATQKNILPPNQVLDNGFTSWQWLNPLPQGNDMHDVQMLDSLTIVTVGRYGTILKSTNGGVTWVQQSSGTTDFLSGVSFADANTGTVVGSSGTILHTTNGGTTWISQTNGNTNGLSGVSFADANTGTVVGSYGTILHTTNGGTTWTRQSSGTTDALLGVSFTDANTGTAVGLIDSGGYGGTILRTTNGGTTWIIQSRGTTDPLYEVCFTDANTGTVVGTWGTILRTTNGGTTWVTQANGNRDNLEKVSFTDANTGTVVGYGFDEPDGFILHTTNGGTTWYFQLFDITRTFSGVSFTDANTGTVVGSSGTILHTTNGGTIWTSRSSGATADLNNIFFANANTGTAVGYDYAGYRGVILNTTNGGRTWASQASGTTAWLSGVSFTNANTGTVVGQNGTILHTTDGGTTWVSQASGTTADLYNISFANASKGTAVGYDYAGNHGIILHTTDGGTTWTSQSRGTAEWLLGVSFADSNRGIAVGYSRDINWVYHSVILLTFDGGATWYISLGSGGTAILYNISFTNASTATAVGDVGKILYTNNGGTTWYTQSSGTSESLRGVFFSDASKGIVVGSGGTILHTTNGGTNWTKLITPTSNGLASVAITSTGSGKVVYAFGSGGTILCAAISPFNPKTWIGSVDSSWNTPGNWNPSGVPTPGDSVIIPLGFSPCVINQLQQQITIASLNIPTGGKLTITDSLARFVVKGGVTVHGTLELRPPAQTSIVVGGSWTIDPGGGGAIGLKKSSAAAEEGFLYAHSTVYLQGSGVFSHNFFNLVFDTLSSMRSNGNVLVENQCTVLKEVNLRATDTLTLQSDEPQALNGNGKVVRGTILRVLRPASLERYRFETDSTYIQFYNTGTHPSALTMTTYPDTTPTDFGQGWEVIPSHVDTLTHTITADSVSHFTRWAMGRPRPRLVMPKSTSGTDVMPDIQRVYSIVPQGGSNFIAKLQLRYDPAEIPNGTPADSLKLLRLVGGAPTLSLIKAWNMVSVPLTVSDYGKIALFPSATSNAFAYQAGYFSKNTLQNGVGYWLKFGSAQNVWMTGASRTTDSITVSAGWNMIGSISTPVAVSNIASNPPSIVTSQFFGYEIGYKISDTVQAGKAYWVKVNQSGQLMLSSTGATALNKIRIIPTNELPPAPPDEEVSSINPGIPTQFALDQNYPNPFNPTTEIRYQIPEGSNVVLKIYNVLGEVVATLVDGYQEAGYKSAVWNSANTASGMYFYRLEASSTSNPGKSFVQVRKMLLMK